MEQNRNDGHNPKLQVLIEPNIGLDSDVRHSVVQMLNIILADEIILTTKTRSIHWNLRGADFFELRALFETQSQLLSNICDEIAERTQMLGSFAIGSLEEFVHHARLEDQPGMVPDILRLLADHEAYVRFLREDSRKCAEEYEDDGTFMLLVKAMCLHEKMAWMLRSSIQNQAVQGEGKVN